MDRRHERPSDAHPTPALSEQTSDGGGESQAGPPQPRFDGLLRNPERGCDLGLLELLHRVQHQGFALAGRQLRYGPGHPAEASAYQVERDGGPQVDAATARFALDMRECQQRFMAHVFATRRLLTPAQAATYDHAVVEALTNTPR